MACMEHDSPLKSEIQQLRIVWPGWNWNILLLAMFFGFTYVGNWNIVFIIFNIFTSNLKHRNMIIAVSGRDMDRTDKSFSLLGPGLKRSLRLLSSYMS